MSIPESVKAIDRQTAKIHVLEMQRDALLRLCSSVKALVEEYEVQHWANDVSAIYDELSLAVQECSFQRRILEHADAGRERPELLHKEEFGLDDLVQTDLTGLGEAVEAYVEEYVLGADLDPDSVDYGWSCVVTVEIKKRKERRRCP